MTKLEPTRTSSDLTATERLRRMLDERGVKWKRKRGRKHDGTEWYDQFGVYAEAVQEYSWDGFEHPEGKLLVRRGMGYLTPEQAIAATLGAGTCHAIISDNLTESEGMGDAWADCSECGHLLFVLTDPNSEPPNYCPNCGRKVVDE